MHDLGIEVQECRATQRREDDDRRTRPPAPQTVNHIKAVQARHGQVEHDKVVVSAVEELQALNAIRRLIGKDACPLRNDAQKAANRRIVVDDQNARLRHMHDHHFRPMQG